MLYSKTILKRKIESIIIFPFILIGRCVSILVPLKENYSIFFFFPFYHTGGVEKYNLALAKATKNKKAIIFFTRKSGDKQFYKAFEESGHKIVDFSNYTDNKYIFFCNLIFRGIISGYVNKQNAIVFNGQSNFAYKISPWIKKTITQYECIHTFSSFSYIRQPFISFYKKAFSPSYKTIEDHKKYYIEKNVPISQSQKFVHLITGINVPTTFTNKDSNKILKILFVGRGSMEKRVHIIAEVAKVIKIKNNEVQFIFAGDVINFIPEPLQEYCTIKGNITDEIILNELYKSSDILILTSLFEGFPLVVMEAMANGLAIISANVGDVPVHVKNSVNGFIVDNNLTETELIASFEKHVLFLNEHREVLAKIGAQNYIYALEHFSVTKLSDKLLPYLNLNN